MRTSERANASLISAKAAAQLTSSSRRHRAAREHDRAARELQRMVDRAPRSSYDANFARDGGDLLAKRRCSKPKALKDAGRADCSHQDVASAEAEGHRPTAHRAREREDRDRHEDRHRWRRARWTRKFAHPPRRLGTRGTANREGHRRAQTRVRGPRSTPHRRTRTDARIVSQRGRVRRDGVAMLPT